VHSSARWIMASSLVSRCGVALWDNYKGFANVVTLFSHSIQNIRSSDNASSIPTPNREHSHSIKTLFRYSNSLSSATMFSRALFLALLFSPLAHSAWTISEMTCHDTDCIAGAVNMGFTFDNGAGLKTHCGLTASPWNVPGDLRTCDDHSIQWKIIEGNRFGGCANFNIQIRADTMQQKDVLINEATDTNYQCSQPVSPPVIPPLPPAWYFFSLLIRAVRR